MFRFLSPLIVLVPQDLNLTLYAQVCRLPEHNLSKGSSFLLITQYEMPFISKGEATKRLTERPKNKRQM